MTTYSQSSFLGTVPVPGSTDDNVALLIELFVHVALQFFFFYVVHFVVRCHLLQGCILFIIHKI